MNSSSAATSFLPKRTRPKPAPAFAYLLYTVLSTPFMVACRGYVVAALWRWFLVPLGLAPVGTAQAAGVAFLVTFLVRKAPIWKDRQPLPVVGELKNDLYAAAYFGFALFLGSLIHRLMA